MKMMVQEISENDWQRKLWRELQQAHKRKRGAPLASVRGWPKEREHLCKRVAMVRAVRILGPPSLLLLEYGRLIDRISRMSATWFFYPVKQ